MSAAASPLYVIPPAPLKGKYNSPRARTHPHFEFPSERWVNLGTFLVKKDSFPGPVVEKDFSSRTGAKPELGLPDFMRSLSQGPFCPLLSCSSVLPITDRRAQERRYGAALWKFLEIGCTTGHRWAEVLALKHKSRILGQWSYPVSGSRKSPASSPWAKQHIA